MTQENEFINIYGAREHNLKDIDLRIPRNQLVVFTGLSGSGKSSLAFDTIFAEGQRRYMETFSSYARQFLGGLERPDVDKIDGLSPVISIEQKTVSKNPRSTVGTITEIYDFFRLLYARVSTTYSYNTGETMVKFSDDQLLQLILDEFDGKRMVILAPKVRGRKGHYRELFQQIRKWGFTKVRVDAEILDIKPDMRLDRFKIHDIDIVIDRVVVNREEQQRLSESIGQAMKYGDGALIFMQADSGKEKFFSRFLMCPTTGISYPDPEPNLFSFNSPYGACPKCNGLGTINEVDFEKIIPDANKSIRKGAILPLGDLKSGYLMGRIEKLLAPKYNLDTPIKDIPAEILGDLLNGNDDFEGIGAFIQRHFEENPSTPIKRWAQSFMNTTTCPTCNGYRLRKESYYFKIRDKHIGEVAEMDFSELAHWVSDMEHFLTDSQKIIAKDILKELKARIGFILEVGLNYLTLNRPSKSLSGGEAQRIRLATQIGSELVNVLYILDEPSIGLHQRDNTRLITSLKKLRDAGNSVLVVEHDKEMIENADFVVDIGPGAGVHGGQIVAAGSFDEVCKTDSLTAQYLKRKRAIEVPNKRRNGNGQYLKLTGASGNNLKQVNLTIPLGTLMCITGVSGSGKSTLVNHTLYPLLVNHLNRGMQHVMPYKSIEGIEYLDKVINIDQSPIGRTPRSNPATYTKLFDEIRSLFAMLPEAQIRGYKPGTFSFNLKGGRCESCQGAGVRIVEMNFLPDVLVECETCLGKRYTNDTLEVRFKGKSIFDVLEMTIEDAAVFFENFPKMKRILDTLKSVGMGYVKLGQPATTLSGGEAQRIKLAAELAKKSTGKTFYILDEPSTGLHFEDVRMLVDVLQRLVDEGNTVLVIEHNLDIIKVADYIVDLGPEGGKEGGQILCSGTPEMLVKKYADQSHTAKYLTSELKSRDYDINKKRLERDQVERLMGNF
jgi:excinuclease ABC subunit A